MIGARKPRSRAYWVATAGRVDQPSATGARSIVSSVDRHTRTEVGHANSSRIQTGEASGLNDSTGSPEVRGHQVEHYLREHQSRSPHLHPDGDGRTIRTDVHRAERECADRIHHTGLHHLISSYVCHPSTCGRAFDFDLHGTRGFTLGNEGFPWETPMNRSA